MIYIYIVYNSDMVLTISLLITTIIYNYIYTALIYNTKRRRVSCLQEEMVDKALQAHGVVAKSESGVDHRQMVGKHHIWVWLGIW